MTVALQIQAKSRLLGDIEICQECRNYATVGKKIPHKKTCSLRPCKPQAHTWESAEEYARWEKAHEQIAKENAMPIRKLQEVLYKEAIKALGKKIQHGVTATLKPDGTAIAYHNGQARGWSSSYQLKIYEGALSRYWLHMLGYDTAPCDDPIKTSLHVWQDPKEAQRWQRVTKQNEQEAKMPFKKLRDKLQQESLKGGSPYNISFNYGTESIKVYYGNPLYEKPIYEGATLANYWLETLQKNAREVSHV